LRAIVVITCVAAIAAVAQGVGEPPSNAESPPEPGTPALQPTATVEPVPSPTAEPPDASGSSDSEAAPVPAVPHIGIVAGHWGFDQGASCPDGLDEVDVNLDVAQRVVQSLRGLGYQVDLLEEYDDRLPGYVADALVSIHSDSCERFPDATPPPTGFKVASVVDSLVPEEERRLVACLQGEYGERTGLVTHQNSITGHMTRYHTFYEIDGRTPGAIIEIGFLWLDRNLLTQRPDLVAQGVVDGIVCFVEGD
jgi:N-acetylmuramoyl-L-alanine amidase